MTSYPLISVLIPVRNTSRFLRTCLDCVVDQSYKNLQIVIAENGSNDSSNSICCEYSNKFKNIEVHNIPQKGISEVRQDLLNFAKGEYIIYIDSDDWIEPEMIESLYKEIEQNDLDFISTQILTNKKLGNKQKITRLNILNKSQAIHEFFLNGFVLTLCVKLVKSEVYKRASFIPEILFAEDYYMTWCIINQSNRIGISSAS